MSHISWLAALALVAPSAAQAAVHIHEGNITYEQLPNAVKATLEREANGMAILSLRQEAEDTRILYRAQLEDLPARTRLATRAEPVPVRTLIVSQDGKVVSGGIGAADDHGNGFPDWKFRQPHSRSNTDQGRERDNDPDKGYKTSTESLDKVHIRP